MRNILVIVLMCSACGATFRPLSFVEVKDETDEKKQPLKDDEKKDDAIEAAQSAEDKKALLSKGIRTAQSLQNGLNMNEKNRLDGKVNSLGRNMEHRKRRVSESTGFLTVKVGPSYKMTPFRNSSSSFEKFKIEKLEKTQADVFVVGYLGRNVKKCASVSRRCLLFIVITF
ncbi:unnamed protein product [Gongylonema pulchrum]|uniref:RxLR effector protein n=1 Tax=Gongylonema pulchrum TaxID=637853 RepID=A0A183DFR7_9BILA|nr:unnamed protein product [Gongylonema pulchrum]